MSDDSFEPRNCVFCARATHMTRVIDPVDEYMNPDRITPKVICSKCVKARIDLVNARRDDMRGRGK
jgi:hypothetical protein